MKLLSLAALMGLTGLKLLAAANGQPKAFPYAYDMFDLDNGLRTITVPTAYPNVVALYIVVQTGSRNEVEAGKTGFAHFFEHMMFRGTKLFPPDRFQATLQKAGAANNAFTSDDLTAYHTTFSKQDLETIMHMEADRFQHLLLRTFDHGGEWEHELLLGDGFLVVLAVDDRGPHVIVAFALDEAAAVLCGEIDDASLLDVLIDLRVDRLGLSWHRERRQR